MIVNLKLLILLSYFFFVPNQVPCCWMNERMDGWMDGWMDGDEISLTESYRSILLFDNFVLIIMSIDN